MRIKRVRGALLLLLLAGWGNVWGSADEVVPYRPDHGQLESLLSPLAAFRGRFEQTTLDPSGRQTDYASGELAIKRPGQFRWDYREPDPQLILADGVNLWVYDMDLDQVTVRAQEEALDSLPSLFLSGQVDELLEAFDIEVYQQEGASEWQVLLTPKEQIANLRMLGFAMRNDQPYALEIEDHFGRVTQFLFSDYQLLDVEQASLFTFTVPEGVDLVGTPK
jgi:outer membrane lipoprotein carrier protein